MHAETDFMRVHSQLNQSRANGPGERAVLWLQGCPFKCPGCYNPDLRDPIDGHDVPVTDLIEWVESLNNIEGISISGGEPTEQIASLISFIYLIKEKTSLSILLYSGRTIEDIIALPMGKDLVSLIDVLIDGPYNQDMANPEGQWPSSLNQKIHFISGRYSLNDFKDLPGTEIIITETGEVIESGMERIETGVGGKV